MVTTSSKEERDHLPYYQHKGQQPVYVMCIDGLCNLEYDEGDRELLSHRNTTSSQNMKAFHS